MPQEKLEQALKNWEEKLAHLECDLSINASPEQKFGIQKSIDECKLKIKELKQEINSTITHEIEALKKEANKAESENNLERAENLWTQILLLSPKEPDVVMKLKNIWLTGLKEQFESENIRLKELHHKEILYYMDGMEFLQSSFQEVQEKLKQEKWRIPKQLEEISSLNIRLELLEEISSLKFRLELGYQSIKSRDLAISELQKQLHKHLKQQLALQKLIQIVEFEIKSDKGVDYTLLKSLLATGKWREADEETARVMRLAAGKEKEKCLMYSDMDIFPCEDLYIIDQLWLHYSNGQFGFSVQKNIYYSIVGTREYDDYFWLKFCDRVGWIVKGEWLDDSNLTFNLNAPRGHLPYFLYFFPTVYNDVLLRRSDL